MHTWRTRTWQTVCNKTTEIIILIRCNGRYTTTEDERDEDWSIDLTYEYLLH
jgi:hypothetical protein